MDKSNTAQLDNLIFNGKHWQPLMGRDPKHCIVTYSGKFFWPLCPHIDEVDVEDIAHGLSMENRFGSQCPVPYSVAWHSYALSMVVPSHLAKWALIHDSAEAYIKDLPRPIKQNSDFGKLYSDIENNLLSIIAEALDMESYTMPEELEPYDYKMGHVEMLVFSEDYNNMAHELKLYMVGLTNAYVHDLRYTNKWQTLVRNSPKINHQEESKSRWLQRYEEIFLDASSKASNF